MQAGTTVVSAGSLHTPALLLRSGILSNGNVGRHLRLHPSFAVQAFYDSADHLPSGPSWNGPMFTAYSRQNAHWDDPAKPYGSLLSVSALLPPQLAANIPFQSGEQFQKDVLSLGRGAAFVLYNRDGGEGGCVTLGPDVCPFTFFAASVTVIYFLWKLQIFLADENR